MQMDDRAEEIARRLEGLVDQRRDAGDAVDSGSWRRILVDAATCEMARVRGVCADEWEPAEGPVAQALERWPDAIWSDPHALGWIHEQYAVTARQKSFDEHVQREKKHASSTVTTQLYTPRWVAEVLVREALELVDDRGTATVCDPAVGGGQMLLAALSVVADATPDAPAQRWATRLGGGDLDPRAVEVARRTLALEVARRKGRRDAAAEAVFERQIVEADALAEHAWQDRQWSVVLTNPPYMGWRSMPDSLRDVLDPRYRPYHHDLFAAFIARCHELADQAVGILAQQAIWYLRRYEKARLDLLQRGHLSVFLHLGPGAFWNLDGEKASVVAFVQTSDEAPDCRPPNHGDQPAPTRVWDLRDTSGPAAKRRAFKSDQPSSFDITSVEAIPGSPICHDLSKPVRRLFDQCPPLSEFADVPGGQNKTGRNRQYVRRWDDVDADALRRVEALGSRGTEQGRWVFYSKGGRFAPWWGNWHWVVDWSDQARAFYRDNRTSNLLERQYWFRQGIVYTDFGGRRFNARWMPPGCVYDMTGPAIFPRARWWPSLTERQRLGAALGVLNSSPARRMLRALNPTLHFQVRDVRALPVPSIDEAAATELADKVWQLVDGVRRCHRAVSGDPLYEESRTETPAISALVALEKEIDRAVCEAYGVDRQPIDSASVADHHALC